MTRLDWDTTWLLVATVVARRSRCVRDQVGAVIVDPRNRIIATGYNGPPADHPATGTCDTFCPRAQQGPTDATLESYVDCFSLHAELNALSVCDRSAFEGGTLYVSSSVCRQCAKMIANSGLRRLVVCADEREYRHANLGYLFLRDCGVTVDVHEAEPAPVTVPAEWCRTCRDQEPPVSTPAEFIVWGKLFDSEDLGPRCGAHLPKSIIQGREDQYAVLDLRQLRKATT